MQCRADCLPQEQVAWAAQAQAVEALSPARQQVEGRAVVGVEDIFFGFGTGIWWLVRLKLKVVLVCDNEQLSSGSVVLFVDDVCVCK